MNGSCADTLHISCMQTAAVRPICIQETGTGSVQVRGKKNQKSESGSWNFSSLGNARLYLLGCLVMMRVCCWHWVVSLRQCEQTWWSCTWHSAATVSRQDDGDDGILVYLYVQWNICQSCCCGVCVRYMYVRSREIQCCCLSFNRFMLCLSFSYSQNAIDTVWKIRDLLVL